MPQSNFKKAFKLINNTNPNTNHHRRKVRVIFCSLAIGAYCRVNLRCTTDSVCLNSYSLLEVCARVFVHGKASGVERRQVLGHSPSFLWGS